MPDEELGRRAVSRSADQIKLTIPKWLWEKRIPLGHMTLLAGREGIGKSSVALQLAALLTRGRLAGEFLGVARSVGIIATEDDWSSTIAPRLVAAGADLSRCFQVEAKVEGKLETVSIPDDVDSLGALCTENEISLMIVDPVMSVLPGKIDTHKDREVRRALDPMAKGFAQKYGVSILGLIHVNKGGSGDALNAIMGSRAFTAVSRSVLFCSSDPEEDDSYVLGHPKSNLGPKMPTIGYTLVEAKVGVQVAADETQYAAVSRAVFGEEDERSIGEILEITNDGRRMQGEKASAIQQFIDSVSGVVTTQQIVGHFPDLKRTAIDNTLTRLVKRGKVDRVGQGVYQGASSRPSITTSRIRDRDSSSSSDRGLSDLSDLPSINVRERLIDQGDSASDQQERSFDDAEDRADAPWPDIPTSEEWD